MRGHEGEPRSGSGDGMSTSTEPVPGRAAVRWRTAFWSAIPATPLLAVLAVLILDGFSHGRSYYLAWAVGLGGGAVLVNTVLWRWPRASGMALGAAAPLLAVFTFLGSAWMSGGITW